MDAVLSTTRSIREYWRLYDRHSAHHKGERRSALKCHFCEVELRDEARKRTMTALQSFYKIHGGE